MTARMTSPRPFELACAARRLAALRMLRAPFAALAVLAVLVNLLLPTALAAMPASPTDAFGPICSGFVGDDDAPALAPHCDDCCPAFAATIPVPPSDGVVVRHPQAVARTPRAAPFLAHVHGAVHRAPRGPPAV